LAAAPWIPAALATTTGTWLGGVVVVVVEVDVLGGVAGGAAPFEPDPVETALDG
jgi:hypothetical protein